MGDRCFLSLTWKKSDTLRILEAFPIHDVPRTPQTPHTADVYEALRPAWFGEGVETVGNECTGSECEANYAYWSELTKLAEEVKVPFYGWHTAGGGYSAGVFVSWRGKYIEIESIDSHPVVPVVNGKPVQKALKLVRQYDAAVKKVEAYIAKEEA